MSPVNESPINFMHHLSPVYCISTSHIKLYLKPPALGGVRAVPIHAIILQLMDTAPRFQNTIAGRNVTQLYTFCFVCFQVQLCINDHNVIEGTAAVTPFPAFINCTHCASIPHMGPDGIYLPHESFKTVHQKMTYTCHNAGF